MDDILWREVLYKTAVLRKLILAVIHILYLSYILLSYDAIQTSFKDKKKNRNLYHYAQSFIRA
jgi:hypothetical protein